MKLSYWLRKWFWWPRPSLQPPIPLPNPTPLPTPATSGDLLLAVNTVRIRSGVPALLPDSGLMVGAADHALTMRSQGRMSHDGFDRRLTGAGMRGGAENVAQGQQNADQCVADWMTSPGHRRNMLGAYQWAGTGQAGTYWCLIVGSR